MRAVLVSLLVLAGCGAARARPSAAAAPQPIPMFVTGDDGTPRVRARLGQLPIDLMVDSGAAAHVLSSDLAWHARLPIEATGFSIVDVTGASATASRLVEPAVVLANGIELPARRTLTTSAPNMEPIALAGMLSPMALATSSAEVIVDLRRWELSWVPPGTPLGDGARFESDGECEDLIGAVHVARVLVDGVPARMIVDTGMPRSLVRGGSSVAAALSDRARRELALSDVDRVLDDAAPASADVRLRAGTSGVAAVTRLAGVAIRAGEHEVRVDLDIAGEHELGCGVDGVLGRDVLSGCALRFSARGVEARCSAPTDPPRREPVAVPALALDGLALRGECEPIAELDARIELGTALGAYRRLRTGLDELARATEAACARRGYVQARARWEAEPDGLIVRASMRVSRGPRHRFGRVDVNDLEHAGVLDHVTLATRRGAPFSMQTIREDTERIRAALRDEGVDRSLQVGFEHRDRSLRHTDVDVRFYLVEHE